MAPKILVPLKSEDRLSQMIPYIEGIAQPGMKVVFLIGFRPQAASKAPRYNSLANVGFVGDVEQSMCRGENIGGTQFMEEQKLSVEHKVFLALEAWLKSGIEITVDVYTGSLRKAVKSYTRKGDVHLIVMRASKALMIMDFFYKAFTFLGVVKRQSFSPILVLRPTTAI